MIAKAFYEYLCERERIRLNREQGLPWPWTKDKILQTYKFTNVRREHDATSRKLRILYMMKMDERATPELIWLNCAIARYFGTWDFMSALGWQDGFRPAAIKKLAKVRLAKGERVFTGAYVITNQGISAPKQKVVVDYFIKGVWENRKELSKCVAESGNWEKTLNLLSNIAGFGGSGFMGKEVTLDTMYFPNFWPVKDPDRKGIPVHGSKPLDYWDWTPIGPGAQRGLVRVMLDKSPREHPELRKKVGLGELHFLCKEQRHYWPDEWGKLAPTDIQFGLCEFDKYERTRLGEGKPRSRYEAPQQ